MPSYIINVKAPPTLIGFASSILGILFRRTEPTHLNYGQLSQLHAGRFPREPIAAPDAVLGETSRVSGVPAVAHRVLPRGRADAGGGSIHTCRLLLGIHGVQEVPCGRVPPHGDGREGVGMDPEGGGRRDECSRDGAVPDRGALA